MTISESILDLTILCMHCPDFVSSDQEGKNLLVAVQSRDQQSIVGSYRMAN